MKAVCFLEANDSLRIVFAQWLMLCRRCSSFDCNAKSNKKLTDQSVGNDKYLYNVPTLETIMTVKIDKMF